MATVTRASHLQQQAVKDLSKLEDELSKKKDSSIKSNNNDEANAYLSLGCAVTSLSCNIKMWILLKEEKPDQAWDELVNAQSNATSALKAHSVSSHLERYSQLLHVIEKIIFPPQVFTSTGLIVKEEECSICGESYEDCEHIAGKPYLGIFCSIFVKDMQLNEVSIVNEPADKTCRITHFDVAEGRRNRMTWNIESHE